MNDEQPTPPASLSQVANDQLWYNVPAFIGLLLVIGAIVLTLRGLGMMIGLATSPGMAGEKRNQAAGIIAANQLIAILLLIVSMVLTGVSISVQQQIGAQPVLSYVVVVLNLLAVLGGVTMLVSVGQEASVKLPLIGTIKAGWIANVTTLLWLLGTG